METEVAIHKFSAYVNPEIFNLDEIKKIYDSSDSVIDPKSTLIINPFGHDGLIFVFYFGAVSFWNVPKDMQIIELEKLFPVLKNLKGTIESEEFVVRVDSTAKPKVEFNHLLLDFIDQHRAEVIAATVAQSATMEHYEKIVRKTWNNVDAMLATLRKEGTISPFPGKLHRKIAESVATRSSVVRVLHLLDRPDLIWDDPTMDVLYNDLRASFDLPERFQALEYKLHLIQDTLALLVDTARDRRAFILEMTIVLLILFEIVMAFVEKAK